MAKAIVVAHVNVGLQANTVSNEDIIFKNIIVNSNANGENHPNSFPSSLNHNF